MAPPPPPPPPPSTLKAQCISSVSSVRAVNIKSSYDVILFLLICPIYSSDTHNVLTIISLLYCRGVHVSFNVTLLPQMIRRNRFSTGFSVPYFFYTPFTAITEHSNLWLSPKKAVSYTNIIHFTPWPTFLLISTCHSNFCVSKQTFHNQLQPLFPQHHNCLGLLHLFAVRIFAEFRTRKCFLFDVTLLHNVRCYDV